MKLIWAVLLMGGIAWSEKPACTKDNIGQPYTDTRKKNNPYPLWVCTHDGWMNVHPGGAHVETYSGPYKIEDGQIVHADAKPLKCGKYQHIEYESCPPSQQSMNMQTGAFSCRIEEKSHCSDDLHTVTEKEWQELMIRLKKIEDQTVVCNYKDSQLVCGPYKDAK